MILRNPSAESQSQNNESRPRTKVLVVETGGTIEVFADDTIDVHIAAAIPVEFLSQRNERLAGQILRRDLPRCYRRLHAPDKRRAVGFKNGETALQRLSRELFDEALANAKQVLSGATSDEQAKRESEPLLRLQAELNRIELYAAKRETNYHATGDVLTNDSLLQTEHEA